MYRSWLKNGVCVRLEVLLFGFYVGQKVYTNMNEGQKRTYSTEIVLNNRFSFLSRAPLMYCKNSRKNSYFSKQTFGKYHFVNLFLP